MVKSGAADKINDMNPRRVRVSVPPYRITCASVTCEKPATIQLTLVDDAGNSGNLCQNFCDQHYELEVLQGAFEFVD